MNYKLKQLLILLGDILIFYLSLYLTLLIRYQTKPHIDKWIDHVGPFTFIFLIWIFVFYISNLYSLHTSVNNSKFYRSATNSLLIGGLIASLYFYLNPFIGISPKTNLIIFIAILFVMFFAWRYIFNSITKNYLPKNKILFIGLNEQTKEIIRELEQKPHLGYKPGLIIEANFELSNFENIPIYSNSNNLKELVIKNSFNIIVLSKDPHHYEELRKELFGCLSLNITLINLANFYELITGKVPIEAINQMWFLENLNESGKKFFNFIKRIYDILFALLIFLLTLPLWPFIALAIKKESKGPIIFKQIRTGKNGKTFRILKFRTMRTENNSQTPTISNDSRVTRSGNFFRKTRIDEIPQIINVIKGEMSFVGPRPERPELIIDLEKKIPFYRERMLTKPGLTGWDQISGEYHSPSLEDTMKKLQYDLYYIKNRNLYLDISILLKTIATVFKKTGM